MERDALEALFSKARIQPYFKGEVSAVIAMERYNYNICLSEAMLPSLHYLEVLLRNQVDKALRPILGEEWLLTAPDILPKKTLDNIGLAIKKLNKEKKRTIHHGDIVAQMTFGFWQAFFHKRYDELLWQRKGAIRRAFPELLRINRRRRYIEEHLEKIKIIRNRIAHHEPILYKHPSPDEVHTLTLELIKGISKDALTLLQKVDRFPQVYNHLPSLP